MTKKNKGVIVSTKIGLVVKDNLVKNRVYSLSAIILSLLVFVFLILLLTNLRIDAQSDPIPLPTEESLQSGEGEDVVAEIESAIDRKATENAFFMEQWQYRSIRDYTVAYVIDDQAALDNRIATEELRSSNGASVFSNWDEIIVENDITPFRVIIIDSSAFASARQDWMQGRYQDGVIIVGINLNYDAMNQITGDYCNDTTQFTQIPEDDFFITYSYAINPFDEEDRTSIHQRELNDCTANDGVAYTAGYYSVKGFYISPLNKSEDLTQFNGLLLGQLVTVDQLNLRSME